MTDLELNFKSLVCNIKCQEDIFNLIGEILNSQCTFSRTTTPWEIALWDKNELENFRIKIDKVDRLYYINYINDDLLGKWFYLLIRMLYKESFVFVQMTNTYNPMSIIGRTLGVDLFITRDPNIFSKVIKHPSACEIQLIYKSLIDDGYEIEGPTEYDRTPIHEWHEPPTLKFLCYFNIFKNKKSLQHYQQVLPKTTIHNLNYFIKTREAIYEYDNPNNGIYKIYHPYLSCVQSYLKEKW